MESRNQRREISPDESRDLDELVFDMVRERLLKAVGASGMWTLQFRSTSDTDSLFGETMAEYIARDIANQLSASSSALADSPAMDESPAIEESDDEQIESAEHEVLEHETEHYERRLVA